MLAVCPITIWLWTNFSPNYSKRFPKAHHPIEFNMIWKAMLIPSLGYMVGLILGMFYYRKPREYKTETYVEDENTINEIKPYVL